MNPPSLKLWRVKWAELGSNQRTRERTDLQSVAFNHSAICPITRKLIPGTDIKRNRVPSSGAENWSRTSDLLITNQLLYQLSYFGLFKCNKELPPFLGRQR